MSDTFSRNVTTGSAQDANFFLGIFAGLIAAIVGAAIWMGITVATGMHVGYVALGIGALVGFAIRFAGHGSSIIFGIFGALFTFLSCLGGEILAVLQRSTSAQTGLFDLIRTVDLVPLVSTIFAHTDPIMYLIYGIGIYEGYKFSMRG
jgi:hypothetical protein